jgi:hypothetical protein
MSSGALVCASSYAANAQAFTRHARLSATIPDGTSTTIAFAERYARCVDEYVSFISGSNFGGWGRRTTFADGGPTLPTGCGDMYPVTTGNPPTSVGTNGYLVSPFTFQLRPHPIKECFPAVAQTGHAGGMVVGMFDGSVRILASNVDRHVFWGAVTPAGGEIVSLD